MPADEAQPEDASEPRENRRKIIFSAAAVIAALGLIGMVYAFLAGDDRASIGESEQTAGADLSHLTTAASRGVRDDNPARPRPSDMGRIVAKTNAVSPSEVPLLRPERRSLFEGGVDPEAGLADTAEPAHDLTPEEIASIIHFLAADDCGFINGQAIAVDGGFTAGLSEVAYNTLAGTV